MHPFRWLMLAWLLPLTAFGAEPIALLRGISRSYVFPAGVEEVLVTDPSLLKFRRVKRTEGGQNLLLIPLKAGKTEMEVTGAGAREFEVTISEPTAAKVAAQAKQERAAGAVVDEVVMKVGGSKILTPFLPFGSLQLTDPEMVKYARVGSGLEVFGERRGFTDLTVYDLSARKSRRYFFTIR